MNRTPRFYVDLALSLGQCQLPEEVTHHALKVLRLQPGQDVVLFNGNGNDYQGKLTDCPKKGLARAEIYDSPVNTTESTLHLELVQAISRKDTMQFALQKAVELGVKTITPVLTENCDIKSKPELLSKRHQQWQKVIIAAAEQCGRATLPELSKVQPFTDWLSSVNIESAGQLQVYLDVLKGHSMQALARQQMALEKVTVMIGPEGGFSEDETKAMQTKGFTAVNLGPRILRFETAAIASLATAQALWGDLA